MRIVQLAGLLLLAGILPCHSDPIRETELKQMIERAVASWKGGRAIDAFNTLDSINSQPVSNENASGKIQAALLSSDYLLLSRKIIPAKALIDSALLWSERFKIGDDKASAYQSLSKWYLTVGNWPAAFRAKESEWSFRDSFNRQNHAIEIDSLKRVIELAESNLRIMKESVDQDSARSGWKAFSLPSGFGWVLIIGLLLLVVLLYYRAQQQKPRPSVILPSAPAAFSGSSQPQTGGAPSGPSNPVFDFNTQGASTSTESEAPQQTPEPVAPPNKDTLLRLQGVELVLIRAEVLASYQNGELKAIRNLLNEYMAQLPFIMKTLDEAINRNETAPILISLQHVKGYLKLFGMQATEKLIWEVESESSTEKVSKLLSRVFQVRNHCRRAADEAKSLLEKIG